jgi:putative inorganic carbon (HCO3(-)) transporter
MTLPSRIEALPLRPAAPRLLAGALGGAVVVGALVAQKPLLATLAVLVAALGLVVLARPDVATIIVVFLVFTNAVAVAVNYHGAPFSIGVFFPFLMVVPVAFHLFRGDGLIFTPGFVLILAFLVVQLVSTLFSAEPDIALEKTKTFMFEGVILYFLLTNAVRSAATLRLVMWAVIAGGAFLGGITLFQELTGTYTRPYGGFGSVGHEFLTGQAEEPRLSGPFGDPNYYAQVLLIAVPFGLLRIWGERTRLLRSLAAGATALAVAGIVLTFSRGAGVAFVIVFILMAFSRYIKAKQAVAVALAVVVVLFAVPEYKDRVAKLTRITATTEEVAATEADVSLRSRTTEMLAAGLAFVDHPLIGVGPDVFPTYYQRYAERVGIEVREETKFGARRGLAPEREAHNLFLGVAADLGALGFLTLVGILFVTYRSLIRARRHALRLDPALANMVTAALLSVTAYVCAGFFLTLAFERYFWMTLALAGAAATIALRMRPPESSAQPAGARRT